VVEIASLNDPETLRQVALLQDRQIHRLLEENASLRAENATLKGEAPASAQQELSYLKELLAQREQELFGRSSERRTGEAGQGGSKGSAPREKPQRGHGPTEQPRLPIVEQVHELPEDGRRCPVCEGQLEELPGQSEDSDEVTVVEQSFVVRRHRRVKYRCRCNSVVVTAPVESRMIPGGRYSVEVAVKVAIDKYLDHMPLERQARAMGRQGLAVTSQALWDQLDALARHLEPTYRALLAKVLSSPLVFADETRWPLLDGGQSPFWAWGLSSADAAFYRITQHRSGTEAGELLGGYRGVVVADGWEVYGSVARAAPFTLVNCWAHVRRKFVEAERYAPAEAGFAIERIKELYLVEREVPDLPEQATPEDVEQQLALRLKLRQEGSRPVVDNLRTWAFETLPTVLPRSGIGKAIKYMLSLWPGLTVFLGDPRAPLDNNPAERALRGIVLGRKNHYGSRSHRGIHVAAIFYSLLESAKLAGVSPGAYLLEAARGAIRGPGTVTLPGKPAS
jgi:transposase